MKLAKINLLFLIAMVLISIRFFYPGITPFISDEPKFQLLIDQHFAEHSFPVKSFRGSSLPIHYGPTAVWFYAIIRFFTANPSAIALYHLLFFCSGFLFFYLSMKKIYGDIAASWGLLLAASSPYLFFYARHPWDNTLLMPITALMLWSITSLNKNLYWPIATLAIGAALATNLHLMSGPIVLAAIAVLALYLYREPVNIKYKIRAILTFAACYIIIVVPYFLAILQDLKAPFPESHATRWGDGRDLWWNLMRTGLFASSWKAKKIFEPYEAEFFTYCGPILTKIFKIDIFGWIPRISAWCLAILPIFLKRKFSLVHIYATFSFLLILLVYQYLNIPLEAHNFTNFWWFPFWGTIATITYLHKKKLFLFKTTILLLIICNTLFTLTAFSYIIKNNGTRGMQHGSAAAIEKNITAEICAALKQNNLKSAIIDLSDVFTQPEPLYFYSKHIDECQNLDLFFEKNTKTTAQYTVQYLSNSTANANLVLVKIR